MIKQEKGAASVFVILIMLVLIVFGIAALTASYANFQLSERTVTWTQDYYALEDQAEQKIQRIHHEMVDVYQQTNDPSEYYSVLFFRLEDMGIKLKQDGSIPYIDLVFTAQTQPHTLHVRLAFPYSLNEEIPSFIPTQWYLPVDDFE